MGRCFFGDFASAAFERGWKILPAQGKAVLVKNWSRLDISEQYLTHWLRYNRNDSLSCRTGDGYVAVDVDVTDEACSTAVMASIAKAFGAAPVRVGKAPKALTVYRTADHFHKQQAHLIAPDGATHKVEVLASGQQFVAYGIHPDTQAEYLWTHTDGPAAVAVEDLPELRVADLRQWMTVELPQCLPAGWRVSKYTGAGLPGGDLRVVGGTAVAASVDLDGDAQAAAVANYRAPLEGMTLQRVADALSHLDPDMEMAKWVQVGFALHHQWGSGDNAEAAFNLWLEWSATGEKFVGEADLRNRWKGFGRDKQRQQVTLQSILTWSAKSKLAAGAKASAVKTDEAIREYVVKLQGAQSTADIREICNYICASHSLDTGMRDQLSGVVRKRMKDFDARISTVTARQMVGLTGQKTMRKRDVLHSLAKEAPAWLTGWCWSQEDDKFVHAYNGRRVSKMSFDATYNREIMQEDDLDMPVSAASTVALNTWGVPAVAGSRYYPVAEPCSVFELDGNDFLNSYRGRDGGDPIEPLYWSVEQEAAVERVKAHFRKILPDAFERGVFLSWLAWVARNPGKKCTWAPILKGTKGDGKSFVLEVMAAALGMRNCKPIGPEILTGDFTGWAEGSCFVLLEELKLQGHNRFDVVNKIKPFISNETVSIHRKGIDPYAAPNTQNYLATTNFDDALPVDEDERRWFCVATPFNGHADLLRAGMDDEYFIDLFNAVREHRDAVAGWLLFDVELVAAFNPNGRAPETETKRRIVEYSESDDHRVMGAVLHAAGGDRVEGVGDELLTSWHFAKACRDACDGLRIAPNRLAQWLRGRGFSLVSRGLKFQGRMVSVWARRGTLKQLKSIDAGPLAGPAEVERKQRYLLRQMLESLCAGAEFDNGAEGEGGAA